MKKFAAIALAVVMAISLCTGIAFAGRGNDLPSGPHYNLNIIGVQNPKTADMKDSSGHVIFINLTGNSKIYLKETTSFDNLQVLDANGTDGDGAKFQLPNPDPNQDGVTDYSVYFRIRGNPNGGIKFVTTASDELGNMWVGGELIRYRSTGKDSNNFENVSKYLLYVYVEIDGVKKLVPIFSPMLEDVTWYWDITNFGAKLTQLRFYQVETIIDEPVWPLPEV